jgi:hypothetical protein
VSLKGKEGGKTVVFINKGQPLEEALFTSSVFFNKCWKNYLISAFFKHPPFCFFLPARHPIPSGYAKPIYFRGYNIPEHLQRIFDELQFVFVD